MKFIWILYIFIPIVLYQISSAIWLKRHPKYDITFIAAEIGAGKSCYAAKLVKQHLKKGWNVYSNDFIAGAGKISVSDFKDKCAPEKSLIIIDEASLEMNSRKFATMPIEIIEYAKMSRHYKNKIVFISQTFGDTDKQIRELAAKIYFIRPILGDSFPGLISMPVRVRGHLGIGLDGQPTMQYKIGAFGSFYFLPRYYKSFNSFSKTERPHVAWQPWQKVSEGVAQAVGVAPSGGTRSASKLKKVGDDIVKSKS